MPGRVPGIQIFSRGTKNVDGQDKPGHDERQTYAFTPTPIGHDTPVPPRPQ